MKSIKLHENKFFNIYKNQCHYLSYHSNNKGVVGSSVLILNENEDKILFIKNFRSAVNIESWETPRGGAEHDEYHIDCAKREAEEETGYLVYNLESLGFIAPETGTMSSNHEVFKGFANEYEIPKVVDTDDQIIEVKWIELSKVKEMIVNNEIICGITLSIILKYLLQK